MVQLYRNQHLAGTTVMGRSGIQIRSLRPLTQQGPMFTKIFVPMDVYANGKIDALTNIIEKLACDFASAMCMAQLSYQSVLVYERTGTSAETLDMLRVCLVKACLHLQENQE